jgi:DNA-3-methyladenine glycosylase I
VRGRGKSISELIAGAAGILHQQSRCPEDTIAEVSNPRRCHWPKIDLAIRYHDEEWGVPVHDDRKLFEFLVLDAFQAGLSWDTILRKRENFRTAFDNFDAEIVSRYNKQKVKSLLKDAGIIRNRLKIHATIENAKNFLEVQREFGSFDRYIWQFVGGKTRINRRRSPREVPAKTRESDAMSEALKDRGFKFVGSTICYAFMQAAGMVNDHAVHCFRHSQLL